MLEENGAQDLTEDADSTIPPSATDIDPAKVQEERRRRLAGSQDEELQWAHMKVVLRGEESKLSYIDARNAWKIADKFVLSEDNMLYFLGVSHRWSKQEKDETTPRLVIPTTMIQEVLQSCHDSLEGGHQEVVWTYHRVKNDYYWLGMYAAVERHVKSCPDCCLSKSKPQLRGYSPGTIMADHPFQIVSMDFVIPLPRSRRGNTALLLFQCSFTGFVMGKAMADTTALSVAQAFEECVYRRFGAPTLIRHDRDPRFMCEVFQAFAEMMQSRSRATLSYRPQANGQQERSVRTVMQSVRVYAEDPLQQDWGDRREAQRGTTDVETSEAGAEGGERAEEARLEPQRSLFKEGDRVWLYMERVKPGLVKKLAHLWHGPFRVKKRVEAFAYELELSDRSGYKFYPVVHVSRLKAVNEFEDRPRTQLAPGVTEEARLDFDEELLPEDSWEPDRLAGEYEVECILDDRTPLSTGTGRAVREFKVKRVGYDEPTSEPAANLSCGRPLYDYLRAKRQDQRLQMVQVADEN
ncbi:unnamed protein product [Phytophthora lilii]|uniref:Unnamed protein product n=1 Tax=Phytophthora lilii TaxID=2077276 RepID=A0A9W7CGD3_9STRA|nr:unnamed protein product [Phytophthora lilii]